MNALSETLTNARQALLDERNFHGHWEGELSTSALSTATAVVALWHADPAAHRQVITGGWRWLLSHQNADGGWGDTVKSFSNISTTLLCWSALALAEKDSSARNLPQLKSAVAAAAEWIRMRVGSLEPADIAEKVKDRYGKDRTFSVPILMTCALCGRLGPKSEAWRRVLPLPFELAALPRRTFAILRLPVVSYALPALIAIGHARFHHAPPGLLWSYVRRKAWRRASRLLHEIQPSSGGFLEAAPLTSFVTMALTGAGQKTHPAVGSAVRFLKESVRPDGSWPIDTNLATWVTTLSVRALGAGQETPEGLDDKDCQRIRSWLLSQQYMEVHPYTDAPPGGWAWTHLSGGVPDGDDTPGALLALRKLMTPDSEKSCRTGAERAIGWLLNLQNRDGGMPTFCRGWGALPFDRSSPDLTAHSLRAWHAWRDDLPVGLGFRRRMVKAEAKALRYLKNVQLEDGSWFPLWFGNQHREDEANPTYGTSMVLQSLAELTAAVKQHDLTPVLAKGLAWLKKNQNMDGGWGAKIGTPSSIEETALALNALAAVKQSGLLPESEIRDEILVSAVNYLAKVTESGRHFPAAPIGFYFAKLWYFEKLYPYVWTVEALQRMSTLGLTVFEEKKPTISHQPEAGGRSE